MVVASENKMSTVVTNKRTETMALVRILPTW
jgi:hypothetical protein